MSQQIDITVVVPVYNSVVTLRPLYERTAKALTDLGKTFQILFVEDGGQPESWNALLKIKNDHPETVSLIRLSRNYGQNAATVCGIAHAKGQAVITIDDDLQTPPEEIRKLLERMNESDADIVFGVTPKQSSSMVRRFGSSLLKRIFHWVDGADVGSSFRLISPHLRAKLSEQPNDQLFLNQVIRWYTTQVEKVEVEHHFRNEGSSGYSFFGLVVMAFRLIFYYTDFPLRLMSFFGLLISIVCFGFGIYYIYEKLVFGAEAGFASIITAIFFATGIIILCLSILGAYISRIYADRIRKPAYSVKQFLR